MHKRLGGPAGVPLKVYLVSDALALCSVARRAPAVAQTGLLRVRMDSRRLDALARHTPAVPYRARTVSYPC